MKKSLLSLALVGAASLFCALPAHAVQVIVDGRPVAFDQPPVMQGGRVLVPLRGVFEQLGATVMYNPATRSITAQKGATNVALSLGSTMASVNGQARTLDSPAVLVRARAMVPLRFVSEALGARVGWNDNSQLVTISSGNVGAVIMPPIATVPVPVPVMLAPHLDSVTVDTAGALVAGQSLHVTAYGTPNLRGTFDVGARAGFPLIEGPAGTYRGVYTVQPTDNNPSALITAHLTAPNGLTTAAQASTTINVGDNGVVIFSVQHNARGTLTLGKTLLVTMRGVPGGQATFDVGHPNLTMFEQAPGVYVGTYTVPLADVNPSAKVIAHLHMADGRTQSLAAPNSVALLGI